MSTRLHAGASRSSLFAALSAGLLFAGSIGCLGAPLEPGEATAAAGQELLPNPLVEGFEAATKSAYPAGAVTLTTGSWMFTDAVIGVTSSDPKVGARAARLRASGSIGMAFDKHGGAETVTVQHAAYGADAPSTWELWASTSAGASWAKVGAPVTSAGSTLKVATFTVHLDGSVRFQLRKTSGAATRIDVDAFTVTDYAPPRLTLATWNVRDLSVASRDDAELGHIADVLQRFDAVAIEEVNDELVLPKLSSILVARGDAWASVTSGKVGNSAGTAERYGVIYRASRLHVSFTHQLPELITSAGLPFDREPFAVGLATNDGRFDFAFLDVHVTWGSTTGPRVAEVKKLADYFTMVQPQEHDVFLVGDFNRDANDASVAQLAAATGLATVTDPAVPTLITGTSTYDQFMLNPQVTAEYHGVHGVYAFDDLLFGGDDAAALIAVSDHRPVFVELQPVADDD